MNCPLFADYTRMCLKDIDFIPKDTSDYCISEKYKDCPFYRLINKVGSYCEYIEKCPAYKYFGIGDFDKFEAVTAKYCLSENRASCERYKMRRSGRIAPENLLPDGTKVAPKS